MKHIEARAGMLRLAVNDEVMAQRAEEWSEAHGTVGPAELLEVDAPAVVADEAGVDSPRWNGQCSCDTWNW